MFYQSHPRKVLEHTDYPVTSPPLYCYKTEFQSHEIEVVFFTNFQLHKLSTYVVKSDVLHALVM